MNTFSSTTLTEEPAKPSSSMEKEKRVYAKPYERCAAEEVNLAATAISLNARLRSSDMPVFMQQRGKM